MKMHLHNTDYWGGGLFIVSVIRVLSVVYNDICVLVGSRDVILRSANDSEQIHVISSASD